MNKVTRFKGYSDNLITKEAGYIYSNKDGLVFINQDKTYNQIYNAAKINVLSNNSNADISVIQTRLDFLQEQLNNLKKTNLQLVDSSSTELNTLNDNTKDYIVTGNSNQNASLNVKTLDLKDFKLNVPNDTNLSSSGNNALLINASDSVQLQKSEIAMNNGSNSNCVKVTNASSLIIKDTEFNGTTYNTIMTGQNSNTFLKNVLIDNCNFNEQCKHINIWFAGYQDNAVLTISNCHFKTSQQFLCISDYANANNRLTVNIINCTIDNYDNSYINNYGYNYAGFMFIESRNKANYNQFIQANPFGDGKVIFNINNLVVKGEKITQDNFKIANGQENQCLYFYCTKYSENSGCIKYSESTKNLFPIFNIK